MNEKIETDILKRRFTLNELDIKMSDIAKTMGYNHDIPDNIMEMIHHEFSLFEDITDIEGGYQVMDAKLNLPDFSVNVKNQHFFVGKAVYHYLKSSDKIALFVCTAGKTVSDRSKYLMNKGDLLEGYVADVIGSTIVEKAMDVIHSELKKSLRLMNINCTNRYSPGYCNWDVAEQQKLFSFLPPNFCGITLTSSSLMIPVKSVSGIIGIGTNVTFQDYQCTSCNSNNCIYRGKKK